jgi:hypothetical protein
MEDQLLRRIRAVNLGHIKTAKIIYLADHGHIGFAACVSVESHSGKSKIEQFCIRKPMLRALRQGMKNRNLDNLLRL